MVIKLESNMYYDHLVTLDEKVYRFTYRWIVSELAWYLDMDGITNPEFAYHGIKLVGGVDLVEPFGVLDFGQLWCVDLSGQNRDPEFDNIATEFVLWYS